MSDDNFKHQSPPVKSPIHDQNNDPVLDLGLLKKYLEKSSAERMNLPNLKQEDLKSEVNCAENNIEQQPWSPELTIEKTTKNHDDPLISDLKPQDSENVELDDFSPENQILNGPFQGYRDDGNNNILETPKIDCLSKNSSPDFINNCNLNVIVRGCKSLK